MSKIRVTLEGATLEEIPINKAKITIGRRPTNDVVLNHLAISGVHAVIETKGSDSFLEDMNSTNGTQVNGQPIKRHYLQNGDVISVARYILKFEAGANRGMAVQIQPNPTNTSVRAEVSAPQIAIKPAFVLVMTGANTGKKLALSKELVKLGTPGIQVATIRRTNNVYFLAHVEGLQPTLLNEVDIGNEVRELKPGDVIDLSGTKLMFSVV